MTRNIFDVMRDEDKLKSAYKAPPKRDRRDYYSCPQENPIRRVLCDFLISIGDPDYFNARDSNYQLEMIASSKGWKRENENAA